MNSPPKLCIEVGNTKVRCTGTRLPHRGALGWVALMRCHPFIGVCALACSCTAVLVACPSMPEQDQPLQATLLPTNSQAAVYLCFPACARLSWPHNIPLRCGVSSLPVSHRAPCALAIPICPALDPFLLVCCHQLFDRLSCYFCITPSEPLVRCFSMLLQSIPCSTTE